MTAGADVFFKDILLLILIIVLLISLGVYLSYKFLKYGAKTINSYLKNGGSIDDSLYKLSKTTLRKYCNHYEYRENYMNLLLSEIDKVHKPTVTLDNIHHTLPYQDNSRLVKPQVHIGQRKLFLSEVQFLTHNNQEYCIYAGSAPGNKTHFLSQLFPHIKLILIDPNKFNLVLPDGRSHRVVPHPDIVHLKSDYQTQSNTGPLTLEYIRSSNFKIYIIEDYMTNTYAEFFKPLNASFISDIRTNIKSPVALVPTDFDILWNSSMMFNWMSILQPPASMIKFRPLYFDKHNPDIEIYENFGIDQNEFKGYNIDFELSKKYGIDFIKNWKAKKYIMPKSKLHIQAWAGKTSSELRMWIQKDDLSNFVEYDISNISNKLFYFNAVDRGLCFHINDNADVHKHFCHCNDCALENKIWEEYISTLPEAITKTALKKKVIDYVIHLNIITNRSLRHSHTNIIMDKNPNFETIIAENKRQYDINLEINKRKSNKISIHKGDSGKR